MTQMTPIERRHERMQFCPPIGGHVAECHQVRILDLSVGGARLEHSGVLRPGSNCHLRFSIRPQPVLLTLAGEIVWSQVVGRRAGRGTDLLFQTGLAFAPEPPEVLLTDLLAHGRPAPAAEPAAAGEAPAGETPPVAARRMPRK